MQRYKKAKIYICILLSKYFWKKRSEIISLWSIKADSSKVWMLNGGPGLQI